MVLTNAEVHKELVLQGQADLYDLLSGDVPLATIKAVHPFARAGGQGTATGQKMLTTKQRRRVKESIGSGRGSVRLWPINRHTSKLYDSVILSTRHLGGGKNYWLYASAPYAKYVLAVDGTKKMVARGVLGPNGQLRKRFKARKAAFVDIVRQRQRKAL
jgi:hypothetical protein